MTMAENKNFTVLLLGLIFIGTGAVFLAVNIWGVNLPWKLVLKVLIPGLLLLAGVLKLIRHFTWSEADLLNRPGKAGLLGGLFWTSLGLVILLDVVGKVETLEFFGAYWPSILILYGLGKIIDYYRLKTASRVRMGEIFGVVFVAVFGWSLGRIAEAHLPLIADLGLENLPWTVSLDSPLPKHDFKKTETLDLGGIESVEIRNLYGDVVVESDVDTKAEIELLKTVRADSNAKAQEIADQVSIMTQRREKSLVIETNRRQLGDKGKQLNTHLALRLPLEVPIQVVNGYGDIRIERRKGNCRLENSYGNITADEIEGNVSIIGKYQLVKATNVTGALTITNRRAPVTVNDVTGNVEVTTDYDLVRASNIQGNISVKNRFGTVRITEIGGTAHIEGKGSEVTVADVTDDVYVSNSHKSVVLTNLKKALMVDTGYSRLEISQVEGPVEIRAAHSELAVNSVEKGIQLMGRGSKIDLVDVRGELGIETSLRPVSVHNFSGPLTIQNEYGDVSIEATGSPKGPVKISNKNGGIDFSIPEAANFTLSAQSVGGEIISDFGPEPKESEGTVSLLETKVGTGGFQIELQTTQARIHIRKRG